MLAPSRVSGSIRRVGLVLKRGAPHAHEAAQSLLGWLGDRGVVITAEPEHAAALHVVAAEKTEMFAAADLILVLGASGWMVHARVVYGLTRSLRERIESARVV